MPDKIKVLLDTDIGTDIDDAQCLAYLLCHPRCELLGITTVTGEAEKRAMLASALCRRAGKDVPIYPGASTPLLLPQRQPLAQQAEALGNWSHQTTFPRGEAVEFLRRTIRAHPGEVMLLTIAPLTNIGLLFSTDPEIPSLLRGLVMMCGRFLEPLPQGYGPVEWNAVGDAHSSAIVYRAPVKTHRSIGLDVTSRVSMTPDQFRTCFRDVPLFGPIMDWVEIWFRDWAGTTFHDPLAAATIFEPSLCRYQKGRVQVDLTEGELFGLTRWSPGEPDAPHEIAVDVDPRRFFDHYRSIVQAYP
ncbi:MAG TPA: nucleoside hydrolase [Bacteroidota bacterium]